MPKYFLQLAAIMFIFGICTTKATADDMVWRAQSQLRFLGYQPGPSDGVMGPSTQRALEAFLNDTGLTVTEEVTPNLETFMTTLRTAVDERAALTPTSDVTDSTLFTGPFHVLPNFYRQPHFRDIYRKLIDIDADGSPELFTMTVMYAPNMPAGSRPSGALNLFRSGAPRGLARVPGWDEIPGAIENPEDFCLHPRGIALGDYNLDGQTDLFIACHGYDRPPFPGETNRILLSQPNGRYRVSTPTNDRGFFHGVSAADFDNDGDLDIVLSDNRPDRQLVFLENNGSGGFSRAQWGIPSALRGPYPMFVVYTPDINDDGLFDLFIAGHEHEGAPTMAFLNDGSGDFSRTEAIRIPPIDSWGTVLDVAVTGAWPDRTLWILRTSGGEGSFYQGRLIQRFQPSDGQSTEVWSSQLRWSPYIVSWSRDGQEFIGNDDGQPTLGITDLP